MEKNAINLLLRKAALFEVNALLALAFNPSNPEKESFFKVFNVFLAANGFSKTDYETFKRWLSLNEKFLEQSHFFIPNIRIDNNNNIKSRAHYRIKFETKEIEVFISKSELDPGTAFAYEARLHGVDNIPALWITGADLPDARPHQFFTKEMSYVSPILEETANKLDIFSEKELIELFNKNKDSFLKVRGMCDITPRLLGSGVDGTAFEVGRGKVLKIFVDKSAALHAIKAMKRLYKSPNVAKHEARIYDVGVLASWYGKAIYYYFIEKMQTLGGAPLPISDLYLIIRSCTEYIWSDVSDEKKLLLKKLVNQNSKDVNIFIQDLIPQVIARIKEVRDARRREYPDIQMSELKDFQEHFNLPDDWLEDTIHEIFFKLITGRKDLHSGNIGVTNYGRMRFFDPTFLAQIATE